MTTRSIDDDEVDAPEAPSYEDAPEQALDEHLVTPDDWQSWPLWAKLRLLRQLRTRGAGRPEQYIDNSLAWYIWSLLGGRGSGKSLEANTWAAEETLRLDRIRIALVARTFSDVRDTIFEGETGLLAMIPDSALRGGSRDRAYNRSLGELFLANGSRFKGFSSEKPNQLRGPQHHRAILDESSSWDDADEPLLEKEDGTKAPAVDTTMSNLMLGLRNKSPDGSGVRMVSSTTPKPNELTDLIQDMAERKGQVRVLSTYSNLDNLDEAVKDVIFGMYEGTDVAAQELEGKILSGAKGAAWDPASVEVARSATPPAGPDSSKVVVGVDPAVTSKTTSDETGLVAVRRDDYAPLTAGGADDHWLTVLEDRSAVVPVGRFAAECLLFVTDLEADELLVEVNNGYDFVVNAVTVYLESGGGSYVKRTRKDRTSVRTASRNVVEYICTTADGHTFVMKPVWQSVDKLTRAKAASVWWHRGRASHAEDFAKLQKQMTSYDGTAKKSPDRLDALTTAAAGVAVVRRRASTGGASPTNLPPASDNPEHPLLVGSGAAQTNAPHPLLGARTTT